ncbi:MAG: hypothetical protein C4582_05310 [Desulfobacteraceae bacterium]|jgi:DNA-binding PadR family transcriptional regulator|nr:MAG: hypothetical protein C4582_05310 [Desulfobacteraceae bacterium]
MIRNLRENDRELLASIAEHRILTSKQVTAIHRRSNQVIRRHLRKLEQQGLVLSATTGFGRKRGRPEKLISLTEKGANMVRAENPELKSLSTNHFTGENIRCLDHHLLTNWFRIHLDHIQIVIPQLSVDFLSPASPFQEKALDGQPLVSERLPAEPGTEPTNGFTPDGVFQITHKEKQKTILFFLEVDMGTESVASPKRDPRDIRQKILNYQLYFRRGQYRRYEKTWNCTLKGFRLLFLAHTNGRLASICRLVQDMPPSDFIWLTTADLMFSEGLSAAIWIRAGKQTAPPESILGPAMACKAPMPEPAE